MAPNPSETLGGREADRMAPEDGLDAARGFLLGFVLGLCLWAGVIALAWAVMVLA